MWTPWSRVRAHERRDVWVAFAALLALIASHSVLETARDALFLARVPATRLPWVYLAIAVVSLVLARAQARLLPRLGGRFALGALTASASIITWAMWWLLPALGDAGLYALYVWSGTLSALVLVHFWALLGDLFSVTQAKRIYGLIGAGSVLGAIGGSAAARLLVDHLEAIDLVLVAAIGFAASSLVPMLFRAPPPRQRDARPAAVPGLRESAGWVTRDPYARGITVLLLGSAACTTLVDFLFKAVVAASVPPEELGAYFASLALVLNGLSLIAQLALVGWLVQRVGIAPALAILPLFLAGGGVALVAFPGLAAALFLKGADGTLRYSLHRTALELLFVPMGEAARRRTRAVVDVVGQRGGQVLASLAVLAVTALGASSTWLIALFVGLALAWITLALALRPLYLERIRDGLDRRTVRRTVTPALDVGTLENLVASLDSDDDDRVLAALDILEHEGRARLVPGLVLYHPSEAVVQRALELFTRTGRTAVVPLIDRLLDHPSPRLRAEAVAARSILGFDDRLLRARLSSEESAEVRATIMVNLIAAGEIFGSDARDALASIVGNASASVRVELAQAIGRRAAPGFAAELITLSHAVELEVRRAAIEAIAVAGGATCAPRLVELLGDEDTLLRARAGLVGMGTAGLDALAAALRDANAPAKVRWQLPRAIGAFAPARAAAILLGNLPDEPDGMVRYRSVRALEILVRQDPQLSLHRPTLDRAIASTVTRAYRYFDRKLSLARGAAEVPARRTPGHELLYTMLADKHAHAVDRLFQLLALRYPAEDFADLYRSVGSARAGVRSSAVELVDNLLRAPLRRAVVGLIDDLSDEERLAAGRDYHVPLALDYEALLDSMLGSKSEAVQDLTVFHIGELGLRGFTPRVASLAERADPRRTDLERTLAILREAA